MDKKKLITILRLVISVILLLTVIILADFKKIIIVLKNFNLVWLLPILFLILLSVIVSAVKWNTLIKAQGVSIKLFELFKFYNCGLFFNNFLPSSIGGDGIRIFLVGKKTENYYVAASSVVVERTIATVSLAFLGLASSVFAKSPSKIAINLMAALFVTGVILVFIMISGWVPKRLREKDGRISKGWIKFAASALELRSKKKDLFICFIQSIVFQMIVGLVVGAIIKGMGNTVPGLPDLFLITSASSVLAMVPLGLNGYGMREGAYIYLLRPLGYTASQAVSISILFAFLVTIYSLIGGINWILISRRTGKSPQLHCKDVTTSELET